MTYDYLIIGGGIVGLSTAWQLQQRLPHKNIVLIEKETELAQHQTGHNSGVIHAGIYYPPTSLKAKFCREGSAATIQFCREHQIPFNQCGKLLVATNEVEYQRMESLFQRAQTNGLAVEWLNERELKIQEPNITGIGAILVASTGIVSYREISKKIAQQFIALGGKILLGTQLVSLSEKIDSVEAKLVRNQHIETLQANFIVSCAGLQADRITRMMNLETEFQIIPFRGEYYRLAAKHNQIVKHLIYPIPDPDLPFLGVHLTRMIDGSVTVGPNAVQGWKREGYGHWNFSLADTLEMLDFSGFWKVLKKHWKTGLHETYNSWFKSGYIKEVQKYCPPIQVSDLLPYPAGIRAQAVLKDGTLVHDFLFAESTHSLHVCNAPSPAATSALPIGQYIVEKVLAKTT
ncbi:L-2-hydroxyglutarate oxidase [Thiolinea disciformis]|uniref:L-2-hydroxyglutarate oxidase n=1 Tax=Thiolinea disciformis TaxID=125614 RepID=UPI00037B6938|nr:L-2-hydroxyglutarate oxidase [Thiolinea disciformis]